MRQVGRAARRIDSNGVASLESPATMAALRAKYPARDRPLPATVTRGQCVDNLGGLREAMLGLERGVSSGPGGLRNEHMISLAQVWGEEEIARLQVMQKMEDAEKLLKGRADPLNPEQ